MRSGFGAFAFGIGQAVLRFELMACQVTPLPGIYGSTVVTAGWDVFGRTEKSNMRVVIMRITGLTGDRRELGEHGFRRFLLFRMREQGAAYVLGDKDPLHLGMRIGQQGIYPGPGKGNIQQYLGVIVGIRQVAKIPPP